MGPGDRCWKVAIPGDINIFALKMNNIDFLPELYGRKLSKNITTLKKAKIDIVHAWKNVYIDPDAGGGLGMCDEE